MKTRSPFLWRFLGGFAVGALLVAANDPTMRGHLAVPMAHAASMVHGAPAR